ncbi:MAG: YfaZ family outer membrane protein [Gammaproteobacteria bacterium]
MMHAKSSMTLLAATAVAMGAGVSAKPAYASSLQLDVNDDAARLVYAWPVSGEQLRADAGWLHHQDTGNIVHLGLHLVDFAAGGARPLRAGLGGKLFFVDADQGDSRGGALGLGGFFDYTFPQYDRLGIGGQVYFAPDVLGVSDVENYREIGAHVRYNLLREADLYLGVRNVQSEFSDSPDVTFDTGLHIGIKLNF